MYQSCPTRPLAEEGDACRQARRALLAPEGQCHGPLRAVQRGVRSVGNQLSLPWPGLSRPTGWRQHEPATEVETRWRHPALPPSLRWTGVDSGDGVLQRVDEYAGSIEVRDERGLAPAVKGLGRRGPLHDTLELRRLNDLRAFPAQQACTITGRGLNAEEWATYLPEIPYEPTCIG
jgi:hypothetical protein